VLSAIKEAESAATEAHKLAQDATGTSDPKSAESLARLADAMACKAAWAAREAYKVAHLKPKMLKRFGHHLTTDGVSASVTVLHWGEESSDWPTKSYKQQAKDKAKGKNVRGWLFFLVALFVSHNTM